MTAEKTPVGSGPTAPPLIALTAITLSRNGRRVLDGLDLTLQPGQRLGLTGANGAGKSTLLRLMVGLERPEAGTLAAFGRECRRERDFHEVRRRIGLVFQDSDDQLFCPTVAEDVAFGPLNLGLDRATVRIRVAETLAALDIADLAARVTHHLSGGEKRLVALATVLAMTPDVLLLDEPTAGLDPDHAERLTELLATRTEAMVVVSHDRDFLGRLTDQPKTLAAGRLSPCR